MKRATAETFGKDGLRKERYGLSVKAKKMSRVLPVFVLVLSLVCLVGSAGAENGSAADACAGEQIYERAHEAVFYVTALKEDGSLKTSGTGFFISADGYALTATHVIRGAASVNAELESGLAFRDVEIVLCDITTDVAVLKLPEAEDGYPYIPLADASPEYGAKLYAIGHPLKTTKIITDGIVSSPVAVINGNDRLLMTVSLANGMSGGPILDGHGRAAGISSGTLKTMSGISTSPTTAQIAEALETVFMEGKR
jgi:S1-C subfamily serine protease